MNIVPVQVQRIFSLVAGGKRPLPFLFLLAIILPALLSLSPAQAAPPAVPIPGAISGLPFTEDFNDTILQDPTLTKANWSTEEEALLLAWRKQQYGTFENRRAVSTAGGAFFTYAIAFGDVDSDGDQDLVTGNSEQNRIILNNGTADPWSENYGSNISNDNHRTYSLALGDVDGDGDLDLVAGNRNRINRLYLNNGTDDPWNDIQGIDITSDINQTLSVLLEDVDNDGDLDLVTGNGNNEANRLYLNNGTADPWDNVQGIDIVPDTYLTGFLALGDIDNDGDLDIVANDGTLNHLYLNNGALSPWASVPAIEVPGNAVVNLADVNGDGDLDLITPGKFYLNNGTDNPWHDAVGRSIPGGELGDVDGDGDLDVVTGKWLYLNNDTTDTWNGFSASEIKTSRSTESEFDIYSIALGDVDGDGDLDLVTGLEGTNYLYFNNGTADPWSGNSNQDISSDDFWTTSVAVGDVDGDGDLDVVTGEDGYPIHLYLNNGTNRPWYGVSRKEISSEIYQTTSLALGDVDGDGDLDLIAGIWNQTNRLYLNNGSNDPWYGISGRDITTAVYRTRSVILEDIDNDRDLDLLTSNGNNEPNRLYLNNGTVNPWSDVQSSDIVPGLYLTGNLTLGDVDNDGDIDLISNNNNMAMLFLSNGSANPWKGVAGIEVPGSWKLADINNDGYLDLLYGKLYINNGTSDPWHGVVGIDIPSGVWQLGDMDGDGHLDLVADKKIYLNNGSANPWQDNGIVFTTDDYSTKSLVLGDVDNDGDLDIVIGNEEGDYSTNRLYLNSGANSPWKGVNVGNITYDTYDTGFIALGDVDGDGAPDLVAGNKDQPNRLYLNNGTTEPWDGVIGSDITSDNDETFAVALQDVDGDGDLDLIAGNNGQRNRLYLNNGTAVPFQDATGLDITNDDHNTFAVALGDVDDDGDLDLIAGNRGQANRLYLNNGTAVPWQGADSIKISSDAHKTFAMALGDVDGDDDLDLVVGNWDKENRVYLNNGTNDPWDDVEGQKISNDKDDSYAVELGDVDNDGDLDLVVGNWQQPNRVYLNNGSDDPWEDVNGRDISNDADDTRSIALTDVDGDDDLDLIAGNQNQPNRLYLNNGTGDPWQGVSGSNIGNYVYQTTAVALADIDNDGDQDLVSGGWGSRNRYYPNGADPWNGIFDNGDEGQPHYNTAKGSAGSIRVNDGTDNINEISLLPTSTEPPNTNIDYWLSNNGGDKWFQVQPEKPFSFPTSGNDLRWRAELHSLSPALSPRIDELTICVPPTAVSNPTIQIINDSLQLDWSSNATSFNIYRGENDPYFAPENAYDFSTVSSWIDPDVNALGDTAVNHTYLIRANDCGESADSKRLGEFDFSLVTGG